MDNQKNRNYYSLVALKGLAMGAADVVPGVSGGTIAFISGIYETLLASINNINIQALKRLKSEGIKSFWKHINGNFLAALFAGILVSVASLAKLISYLLENQAILLWSFFFGLVAASIIYVGRQVTKWNTKALLGFIIGAGLAYYITILPPLGKSSELWFIFVSGMIAICAMILPGISGSFILLILGSYETVILSIKELKWATIALFAAGCVIGLLSFSRVLKWMFDKYKNITIAVLAGFLLGSLNKLWPWKVNEGEPLYVHSDGKEDFLQVNVMPSSFEGETLVWSAVVLCILGASIIFSMEFLAKKSKK